MLTPVQVRRAAIKCLCTIVLTHPASFNDLFVKLSPALILQFRGLWLLIVCLFTTIEREENVRVDIVRAYWTLLNQFKNLYAAQDQQHSAAHLQWDYACLTLADA